MTEWEMREYPAPADWRGRRGAPAGGRIELMCALELSEEIGCALAPQAARARLLPEPLAARTPAEARRRGRGRFREVRDTDLAGNLVGDNRRGPGREPIERGDGGRAAYSYRPRRRSEAEDFDED